MGVGAEREILGESSSCKCCVKSNINKTSCTFLFYVEQHLNLESSTADEEFKCTVESAEDNTGLPYNDISS